MLAYTCNTSCQSIISGEEQVPPYTDRPSAGLPGPSL